jgi:transcriptional regulator with XRE-family HTH domain
MRKEGERVTWGEYVLKVREATGLVRQEFARRIGVNPATVWRWETKGQRPESVEAPQAMAQVFALDLDEVLAAAGMRPDVEPSEPTHERDEEVELIRSAPVSERMKKRMLARLEELREQDKQRRMNDIGFILDQAGGGGRRESA